MRNMQVMMQYKVMICMFTYQDKTKRGMVNAWEPMKKRNSCEMLERLKKEVGTTDHILGK